MISPRSYPNSKFSPHFWTTYVWGRGDNSWKPGDSGPALLAHLEERPRNKPVPPEEAGLSHIPALPATLLSDSHSTGCDSFPASGVVQPFSALVPHSPVGELFTKGVLCALPQPQPWEQPFWLSSVYMLSSLKAGYTCDFYFLSIHSVLHVIATH